MVKKKKKKYDPDRAYGSPHRGGRKERPVCRKTIEKALADKYGTLEQMAQGRWFHGKEMRLVSDNIKRQARKMLEELEPMKGDENGYD